MYAKIFSQIYDGTLCTDGPWEALVTFQQMLVLADKDGIVDMTASAISRRTTIPIEIITKGIAALEKEDPFSRTPTENGRRIMLLAEGRSWGWRIVNYQHYRQMQRESDRAEYHRDYYKKRKDMAVFNTSQQSQQFQPVQPIAEAVSDVKDLVVSDETTCRRSRDSLSCPHQEVIDLYHQRLPTCPPVVAWNEARRKTLQVLWREKAAELKWKTKDDGLQWFSRYFDFVAESDFLTGKAEGRNGGKPFVANLEWIIKPSNRTNIVEGKYHA